jgi:hypothetical protein
MTKDIMGRGKSGFSPRGVNIHNSTMDLYFSDYFRVSEEKLDRYGAFNVSLVTDLPLFIDPFLLFNSRKQIYRNLHDQIIRYLRFLRDKSTNHQIEPGLLASWYYFREIKQTWLGFSESGNRGRGLGHGFAIALNSNLRELFSDFGKERITKGSHLEKLCLIKERVGRDTISDFTTNLIKGFLLDYTQTFAQKYIDKSLLKTVAVRRVRFNYVTETWESKKFELPFIKGDYVILTPRDILTKDDTWINRTDLVRDFQNIPDAIPDEQLRSQINNYFLSILPKKPKQKDFERAVTQVTLKFPKLIDYYIKYKELHGKEAVQRSFTHVSESKKLYVNQYRQLIRLLSAQTDFYLYFRNTADETYQRILFLKDVIENKGGYRIFYIDGKPIRNESDLHILYRFTWFATPSDVSHEVNDGRGPADFKISRGSKDKTLVEMKLASNSRLKRNLTKQAELYQKASDVDTAYKVILYFTATELRKVERILSELKLSTSDKIILIDARNDNKPSASKA